MDGKIGRMDECMGRWMDGLMDAWMDGWKKRRKEDRNKGREGRLRDLQLWVMYFTKAHFPIKITS